MFDVAPDVAGTRTRADRDARGVVRGRRLVSWRSAIALCVILVTGLAGGVANSVGDLSTQISASQSAAESLRSQIAAETAQIERNIRWP